MVVSTKWLSRFRRLFLKRSPEPQTVVINVHYSAGVGSRESLAEMRRQTEIAVRASLRSINGR